ncbi:MAG: hypothetical protein ACRDCQ_01100 [Aeromonas sobria]
MADAEAARLEQQLVTLLSRMEQAATAHQWSQLQAEDARLAALWARLAHYPALKAQLSLPPLRARYERLQATMQARHAWLVEQLQQHAGHSEGQRSYLEIQALGENA